MVIMYHEVENYQAMPGHVGGPLEPGGRLVIVDLMPHETIGRPRADRTQNHVIFPALVESEVRQAGFEVISRDDRFIDHADQESTRWMIVFRKPSAQLWQSVRYSRTVGCRTKSQFSQRKISNTRPVVTSVDVYSIRRF